MLKKKKFTAMALALCLSTGGCTSLNGVVRTGIDPVNGEPRYENSVVDEQARRMLTEKYGSPAAMIAGTTAEEINLVYVDDGFAGVYQDADFDASYTPTQNGARLDLNWKSRKYFFPPGVYQLRRAETYAYNNKEGIAFSELVRQALDSVMKKIRQAGITRFYVQATFSGSADGLPIRRPIYYQGEYGPVNLASNTTLNGSPHSFFIQKGQAVNNGELAALRAVSMADFLHRYIDRDIPLEDRYEIRTSRNTGASYRTASVSITIIDN